MFDRFTDRARKVMRLAETEAQRLGHREVGPEHVLLGLIAEGGGVAAVVFGALGVDTGKVRAELEKKAPKKGKGPVPDPVPLAPPAEAVIALSAEEAKTLMHPQVGTEHLLLGLLRHDAGVAAGVLGAFGLTADGVREEVTKHAPPIVPKAAPAKPAESSLVPDELPDDLSELEDVLAEIAAAKEREIAVEHFEQAGWLRAQEVKLGNVRKRLLQLIGDGRL
ncbi:MAG: Clp protease N-terminal domain-containing protein [Fimbriiglobus sp.]